MRSINFTKTLSLLLGIWALPIFATAQYCTPTTTQNCTVGNYQMWINNFSTTGGNTNITNNASGCGNSSTSYIFYNNMMHAGIQGTVVNFSVRCGDTYPMGVKIWVDYNQDGDFTDAGENVYNPTSTLPNATTATGSFTIPANAPPGITRMRVRCNYASVSFTDCGSITYGETEDYVFEVVPSCPAKFTLDPTDQQACEGYDATFKVVTTSTDSVHWQTWNGTAWAFLGDDANYTATNTHNMNIKGLTFAWNNLQYRAVAFNKADNCSVNSKPAKLVMIPTTKSSIVIAPNPGNEICEGTEVTLYSAWTNGGNAPGYQWQINGKDIPGATDGSLQTTNLQDEDTVTCVFISSNICVYPETSNPIVFDVNAIVEPGVEVHGTDNGDGTHTYTANPINGGDNPVYVWYRNTSMVNGQNEHTYLATDIKAYEKIYVQMVSKEKCVETGKRLATSNVISAAAVGISSTVNSLSQLSLHPNPNSGHFNLVGKLDIDGTSEVNITITNSIGQVVMTTSFTAGSEQLNVPVRLDNAPNGLYVANITVDGATTHMRFVVAK